MYRSLCPRWHGTKDNIRHIVVAEGTGEDVVTRAARSQSGAITGSKSCEVQLLQKYHMLIQPKKSYPALTALTFHGYSGSAEAVDSHAFQFTMPAMGGMKLPQSYLMPPPAPQMNAPSCSVAKSSPIRMMQPSPRTSDK